MAKQQDYVIVGAGVFGASTALNLIRRNSTAKITLIDREPFPCSLGASWDWNKVIRSEYTDLFSTQLALEAKHLWRTDPIYKKWYHEDGMYWISDTDLADVVVTNYKKLGVNEEYEVLSTDDAKPLYGGMFADGDYKGVSKVLLNKNSGWAEAKYCLQDVIQAAVDEGVTYVAATIASLEFDEKGACTGVRTTAGDEISASKTVLCTGAGTAKLIADSSDREELQVGERMVAAGINTGLIKMDEKTAAKFQGPVCCQDVLPGRGGSIPPNPQLELKFWRDVSFRNTVKHSSGKLISMPPYDQPDQGQWNISEAMKAEVRDVNYGVFGEATRDMKIQEYRICWDAITPNEDFIISPHPRSSNLHIATAGSFHGWKFFPVLGKYVVQMLHGELDAEKTKVWAWDRDNGPSPYGDMWPKREMKDLYE